MKPPYQTVLRDLDLLQRLAAFQPTVIGTPPLGLAIASSDIDIACTAADLSHFAAFAEAHFGNRASFGCHWLQSRGQAAVCVAFAAMGWAIELFCQTIPIERQWGVRHFAIEKRLLEIEPRLRDLIVGLKQSGRKTEPAFAQALGLVGDPYEALLLLEERDNESLAHMTTRIFE